MNNKKQKFFWSAVFGVLVLITYAWLIEPNWIQVRQVVIDDQVLAEHWPGLRILQISDLHIDQPGYRERQILKAAAQLRPDLIVITGDMTQWGVNPTGAQEFLKNLKAPYGVFAVLGDSDSKNSKQACFFCHENFTNFTKRNFSPYVLENEIVELSVDGVSLSLMGISVDQDGQNFIKQANMKTNVPLLILSHRSVGWSNSGIKYPHLWLSGDTHGGQIFLPSVVWKLIRYKDDPEHMAGLYANDRGGWLYVNKGIGTTYGFPFRFGVRPEITLIEIRMP